MDRDASPVVVIKGKILLNFLSQLTIPYDKISDWLLNKSPHFKKGLKWICNLISSQPDIIEFLVAKTPEKPLLYSLWTPILNQLNKSEDRNKYLQQFINFIPREWGEFPEDDDRMADQIRVYSVLAYHCKKLKMFDDTTDVNIAEILTHFISACTNILTTKTQSFVKYECLNLVGIIYNFKAPMKTAFQQENDKNTIIADILQEPLFTTMNQYFHLWSMEFKPNTKERKHYEMIFEGILNLVTFSKSAQALKLLYRVIREEKTFLEFKLSKALHVLIINGINKLSMHEFLSYFRSLFNDFIDFENETMELKETHGNLGFGIVRRLLLKIFNTCPFEYLIILVNDLAVKLVKRLQDNFKDIDTITEYTLKESGYIIQIFDVWTTRISKSSTNVKDFYNAIKIQGLELTKQLIKI